MATIIVAYSKVGQVIGDGNAMPWHVPDDLKHFKQTTEGNIVLFGRRTWNSLRCRPLPNRTNVVLTRSPKKLIGRVPPDVLLTTDLRSCITWAEKNHPDRKLFIAGGGEVYRLAIDCEEVDSVIASVIDFDCSSIDDPVTFPSLGNDWSVVEEIPMPNKQFLVRKYDRVVR